MGEDRFGDEFDPHGNTGRYLLLLVVGALGVAAEVIGLGMVFAWLNDPRSVLTDPRFIAGAFLALVGLIIIMRGFALVVKKIMRVLLGHTRA